MKAIDHLLARWRIDRATPWIRPGDRLLDIGCHDGRLLRDVRLRIEAGTGIDPIAEPGTTPEGFAIFRGHFPADLEAADGSFDCITALAVLEHVHEPEAFAAACFGLLAPGGRVVLTVPHPAVDRIVDTLIALKLADGMDFEEHHGFDVRQTARLFEGAGFSRVARRPFQLGLNWLFVFERPAPR